FMKKKMAHALRLSPEEWRAMCYLPIHQERGRFRQRLFYGKRVSADDLNYRWPLFLGSVKERLRKQQPFSGTNLVAAIEINRTAGMLLGGWPAPLCQRLRSVALAPGDPAALTFRTIFGNFYRHLF